ncbi:DUF917 domain-containing protein [Oceanospirillum beijerinckii]|uniref:DUF917 domain-containing protein n=1 Tax=Oceanospirillum beijerinckii TaxID=64976 RepID=UPI0004036131|nr:DUF917 domain-containing protein [Oceanospirillum beijerinckii]
MDSNQSHTFTFQDLDDIAVGAHFYACGGGGALVNGQRLVADTKKVLEKRGLDHIQYLEPDQIPDHGWFPVMGAMGAPQKFLQYGYGESPVSAFLSHERLIKVRLGNPGFTFCSLMAAETGTIAHGMALLVAANLELPVINGDGAGRAVPCIPMLSFANQEAEFNLQISPCVLASETSIDAGGAKMNLDCNDTSAVDALARSIISANAGFHGRASLSCYAMKGLQAKQEGVFIHHTMTRARDLGRSLRLSDNPLSVIDALPTAKLLCQGYISRVSSTTRGGFDWLEVYIENDDQEEFVVVVKNENMLVWSNKSDSPIAMAPDLISYIQPDGTVLSNTEIQNHFMNSSERLPICLYSLLADRAMYHPWFHKQYASVFKHYGYYGSYRPPVSAEERNLEKQSCDTPKLSIAGIDA